LGEGHFYIGARILKLEVLEAASHLCSIWEKEWTNTSGSRKAAGKFVGRVLTTALGG
jgi:hypothetical protein